MLHQGSELEAPVMDPSPKAPTQGQTDERADWMSEIRQKKKAVRRSRSGDLRKEAVLEATRLSAQAELEGRRSPKEDGKEKQVSEEKQDTVEVGKEKQVSAAAKERTPGWLHYGTMEDPVQDPSPKVSKEK